MYQEKINNKRPPYLCPKIDRIEECLKLLRDHHSSDVSLLPSMIKALIEEVEILRDRATEWEEYCTTLEHLTKHECMYFGE